MIFPYRICPAHIAGPSYSAAELPLGFLEKKRIEMGNWDF